MKKFVYVLAYQTDDGPAFMHTFLKAKDEDDAYAQGGRWSDAQPEWQGSGLNDYVIPLGTTLADVFLYD